ncbi:hypothetical protein CWB72_06260 [Pseudoalteromonas phenolica]|uniref:hypothetical protein n=1 Tax=Pseudoalteromonas phenolica TaxID=161398 RepID=UPI00110B50A8|nr:hypothetical protein [Pseudoalteromonas phenolica]TMN91702.1 hypothetical protein CWB72_06260 [Pseudoalteromonas phenolica]
MEFKKSVLALGVLTVLSGCGSSDDDKKTTPPADEVVAVTSDIKGVASKGTFINAPVHFYKYVDGAPVKLTSEELGAASTMTDENGQYSGQVKVDGLVKVEIGVSQDISSPTFMICDAPSGCGQNAKGVAISFGERVNMTVKDPTFKLSSLISAAKNEGEVENTANITPLTHFATALAEQRGDVSAESISKAQSEIADTFGLIGTLNELIPAKVEDHASLVDEDESDNLRYALINAGIAQALFVGSEGNVGDMSARLDSAIADLVAADGAFLVSSEHDDDAAFELTLEDILKGAEQATQQIIVLIKQDPVLAKNLSRIADFELLVTKLNNEVAKKKADAGDDGRSKGTETDTTEGDAVAKAAAMVNDVRVFANLFDVANTSGKEVQTQGEEFVQLVEDASVMVEEQADSFKLLSDVSEALAVIDSLRRAEQITEKTVQLDNYLATSGATGVVTLEEDGLTFNVQASAGAESLSANAAITTNDANTEYTLKIDGIIENDAAKFTLNEGTQVSVSLNKAVTVDELKSDTFDIEAHGIEAVKGALNLELTLAQKKTETVTNPVSFNGQLSAELVPVIVEELNFDNTHYAYQAHVTPTVEKDTIAVPTMINLSGAFNSLEGDSVTANFTVNVANASGYQAAGFSYYGRLVDDVASLKFESDNVAQLSNQSEEVLSTHTLLRSGEKGIFAYEVAAGNTTETIWSGEFNGRQYLLKKEHVINGNIHEVNYRFYRIESLDYGYELQYTNIYGDVTDFNDGQVVVDGTSVNVEDLYWSYDQYSDEIDFFIELKGFVSEPQKILNLHSLLSQPAYQQSRMINAENIGLAFAIFPDSQPEVGQSVNLAGRLILEQSDMTYDISVNESGSEIQGELGPKTLSFAMDKNEDGSFTFVHLDAVAEKYSNTVTVTLATLQSTESTKPYFFSDKTEYIDYSEKSSDIPPPEPLPEEITAGYYFNPVQNGDSYSFEAYRISGVAEVNDDNQLVDSTGELIKYEEYEFYGSFYSLESAINYFNNYNFSLNSEYPAIDSMRMRNLSTYIEDKGYFQVSLYSYGEGQSTSYAEQLQPGATVAVPTYLDPADTFELEDEDNFLDISAALNVDVVLGDYAVDLTLSGVRTELEHGEFDLDIKYVIPGSEAQRSFIVEYDTKTESLSAKNAEGVSLEIIEPETVEGEEVDEEAEVEIGKIMVGEEVAATILKRGSIVLIKYTDGAIESL